MNVKRIFWSKIVIYTDFIDKGKWSHFTEVTVPASHKYGTAGVVETDEGFLFPVYMDKTCVKFTTNYPKEFTIIEPISSFSKEEVELMKIFIAKRVEHKLKGLI